MRKHNESRLLPVLGYGLVAIFWLVLIVSIGAGGPA